jgi:hypothetical protein
MILVAVALDAALIFTASEDARALGALADDTVIPRAPALDTTLVVAEPEDARSVGTVTDNTMRFRAGTLAVAFHATAVVTDAEDPGAPRALSDHAVIVRAVTLDAALILTTAENPGALYAFADDAMIVGAVALDGASHDARRHYGGRTRDIRIRDDLWH